MSPRQTTDRRKCRARDGIGSSSRPGPIHACFVAGTICLAVSVVGWTPAAATGTEDARLVEGLRQRRLFSLAEVFCRERLADAQLSEADRAELVIQLMRCHAGHAMHALPADREPLWQRARQAATDFQRDHASNSRQILVRLQDALITVTQGELLRLEAELLPSPGTSLEDCKQVFREAIRLLDALDQDLTREIPQRHRQPPRGAELSADELTTLQHHVRYQQSRAQRGLALCYDPDSDDRIAMLTQAVRTLQQPLTQIAAADPLAARLRIEQAGCYRLLGDLAAAHQTLEQVQIPGDQPEMVLEARAETARLHLAHGRPEEALQVLSQGRETGGRISPELDFAQLETWLALWREAHDRGDAEQANQWQSKAAAMVHLVEQVHGLFWGRRSDLLLVHTISGSHEAADLEVLIRSGDSLYRKGQADDAIAAYEKAAQTATAAGRPEQAFELRYKAALVEQNREHHRSAAGKLRTLASQSPTQPKAAEAHLLAAWNAAQAAQQDKTGLETYAEILAEHLALWTAGKTSDTVRLWLGRLRERQQQWSAAAEAYQGISRESTHFIDALPAAIRCWQNHLNALGADSAAVEATAQTVAEALAAHVEPLLSEPAQPWSEQDRLAALGAARFLVFHTQQGGAQAESLLRAALDGEPPGTSAWRAEAEPLLVLALAFQDGKRAEAERTLRQLGAASAVQLEELLAGLSAIGDSTSRHRQPEIAALRLAGIEMLGDRLAQLDAAAQARIERWRAESLAAVGQHAAALAAYAKLAVRYPDDAVLQVTYAELLMSGDDPRSWTSALDQWRRIATRARPQSELWYQARFGTAAALVQLGRKQEAAERIRYVQATTPALTATPWAQKFADLLRACQSP